MHMKKPRVVSSPKSAVAAAVVWWQFGCLSSMFYCSGCTFSAGPRLHNFFMLNSVEHEIYPALNVKMPIIIDILRFISRIITASENLNEQS